MKSDTKEDKILNCLILIGAECMPILQKSIAMSEEIPEVEMNVNFLRHDYFPLIIIKLLYNLKKTYLKNLK